MSPARVIAHSDLILTAPRRLALAYQSELSVCLFAPLELPGFTVVQVWHERHHADPAHRWLRQLVFEACRDVTSEIRRRMQTRSVYRGKVLSLSVDGYHELQVDVLDLPTVSRDEVILPAGVLDRIERQTLGFSKHAQALRSAARHLKRGILLHGPPGTGKTLTARYLVSSMGTRTTLVLTGRTQGLIEESCAMARALQPSIVILEDVTSPARLYGRSG